MIIAVVLDMALYSLAFMSSGDSEVMLRSDITVCCILSSIVQLDRLPHNFTELILLSCAHLILPLMCAWDRRSRRAGVRPVTAVEHTVSIPSICRLQPCSLSAREQSEGEYPFVLILEGIVNLFTRLRKLSCAYIPLPSSLEQM
jgi:hypothetical protein